MGDPDQGGLSTLDMLGSSPAVNRVVRIMLKKPRMSYQELLDEVSQLPQEKRVTPEMLDEALKEMIGNGWLEKTGDGPQAIYTVVLKPKATSAEQLHSSDLPPLDVAGDRKIDPGLNAPEVTGQPRQKKRRGLMQILKDLFSAKQ